MGNSAKKRHTLWHDWLTYDFILGVVLQILVLLVSMFVWSMGYPKLTFQRDTVLNLLYLVLFLPFIVGVLGLWSRTNELIVWTRFFTSLSLPVLVLGIISTCIMCMLPPYCSSTTNTSKYLIMDRDVPQETQAIAREIFPKEITPGASNVTYRYYKYSSILEDSLHLSLGENLPEEAFASESERIMSLPLLTDAEVSSSKDITLIDASIDDIIVHITVDKAYKRIIYSAGCNKVK